MSPMTTGPMLESAYLHGFWNGATFGSALTLILVGVFFALGGRILIERVTRTEWSQRDSHWP